MKKKIGIITFHASYNCGSMLQAYALQRILTTKYDSECEIINFSNSKQRRMYSILYKPKKFKDVLRNLLNLCFFNKIKKHNEDYVKFAKDHLIMSKQSSSTIDELEKMEQYYDIYIAGSDQVWNLNAQDFDDAYFLPFVHQKKRIAYAVSLGATNPNAFPENKRMKYAQLIKAFDGVSVREGNAEKWIRELCERQVDICVDPTLLLKESDWEDVTSSREIKEKYIFWYTMTYRKDVREKVIQIGKKYNMPVYVLDAKEWSRRGLFLKGIHLAKNSGPSSFLSLVKNAEIVITSSFHGTVFCNIFKKNFWYVNIHEKNSNDDRAVYLLDLLGLTNRYIKIKDIKDIDLMEMPTYDDDQKLQEMIENSHAFLNQHCL